MTLGGAWSRPPKRWRDILFVGDEEDGVKPSILDKAEWGTGRKAYIWLTVTDTGVGMSEEEQKMLFGWFAQTTPRTHIKYGGSGLGLFISKSLSSLQGGSIGAKSQRGVGSTLAFYIGARLTEPPPIRRVSTDDNLNAGPTSIIEEAMRKVKLNVLIVEDNLVNQKVLKKRLQMFGWNVSVAGNGQEALEWLKESVYWQSKVEENKENKIQQRHDDDVVVTHNDGTSDKPAVTIAVTVKEKQNLDIILMDIEMPIMDGLACTRIIRDYELSGQLAFPSPQTITDSSAINSIAHSSTPSTNGDKNDTKDEDMVSPLELRQKQSQQQMQAQQESQPPPPLQQLLRLPIVAVSANARSEQVATALASGCSAHIAKPFRAHELWPKTCSLVKRVGAGAEMVVGAGV